VITAPLEWNRDLMITNDEDEVTRDAVVALLIEARDKVAKKQGLDAGDSEGLSADIQELIWAVENSDEL